MIGYQLHEEDYSEVAKMIDWFANVEKNIKYEEVIYSAAKPKPGDFSIRSIIKGEIRLNHKDRLIKFSEDLELASELKDNLAKLILKGN